MSKILVLLSIPMLDESYDLLIPINKKVGTIKKYIIQNFVGNEMDTYQLRLYDKTTGNAYDENSYVMDSGIVNGSKIVLI